MAVLAERDCLLVSSPAHLKRLPEHPAWATTVEPVAGGVFVRRTFIVRRCL